MGGIGRRRESEVYRERVTNAEYFFKGTQMPEDEQLQSNRYKALRPHNNP